MDFWKTLADLGFPIAAAIFSGYFVFLSLKFILAGVISSIVGVKSIIEALDDRIDSMINDVQKLDVRISQEYNIEPSYERLARLKHDDVRRD
jgi:hypothetical protein